MAKLITGSKKKYNREFQKNEVIKNFILEKECEYIDRPFCIPESLFYPPYGEENYLCLKYKVKDIKEYTDGFGPSVFIRVNNEDTIWKRSRNKWNSFDKIRAPTEDNGSFEKTWDQNKVNSYYIFERMYYYLDKEKHRDKYSSIRAKLYLTRAHQTKDWVFLLQFIIEHLSLEEQENSRRIKLKRRNINNNIGGEMDMDKCDINSVISGDSRFENPFSFIQTNQVSIPRFTSSNVVYTDTQFLDQQFQKYNQTKVNSNVKMDFAPYQRSISQTDLTMNDIKREDLFVSSLSNLPRTLDNSYLPSENRKEKKKRRTNDSLAYPIYLSTSQQKLKGNIIEDEEILRKWFTPPNKETSNSESSSHGRNLNLISNLCNSQL